MAVRNSDEPVIPMESLVQCAHCSRYDTLLKGLSSFPTSVTCARLLPVILSLHGQARKLGTVQYCTVQWYCSSVGPTVISTVGWHKPSLITPLNFKISSSPALSGSEIQTNLQFYQTNRSRGAEQNSSAFLPLLPSSPPFSSAADRWADYQNRNSSRLELRGLQWSLKKRARQPRFRTRFAALRLRRR